MTLRAAAYAGAWSPELTTALTNRYLALCTPPTPCTTPEDPPAPPPDGLATVLWALAMLPQSDDTTAATAALRPLVETHLEQFGVKELARVVWALAVLDQLDMDLLQAMTARVQVRPQGQSLTARGISPVESVKATLGRKCELEPSAPTSSRPPAAGSHVAE